MEIKYIKKALVANRGEIAVRLIKSCKKLNIETYAIYTPIDASSPHVLEADNSIELQGGDSRGYLNSEEIVNICEKYNINCVLPGYGFLSENSEFAEKISKLKNCIFIGPSFKTIILMGLKHEAREIAIKANVPIVPGSNLINSFEDGLSQVKKIGGFPIMVKASAGGGGMGLMIANNENELLNSINLVKSRGSAIAKDDRLFLEKYFNKSRHIEVQIFGNGLGDAIAFGERECSVQRRHQKVIEESPSPFIENLHPELREKILNSSVDLAKSVNYKSAGTIEYLVDDNTGNFYFLEMNTRLQVEHGVTELRFDIDLVELMLKQADSELGYEINNDSNNRDKAGLDLSPYRNIKPHGAAIEVRVYAENPSKNYIPSPGLLQQVVWPNGKSIRVDTWCETGMTISPYYDPLLAKIMAYGSNREEAIKELVNALQNNTILKGTTTNLRFLIAILKSKAFLTGNTTTDILSPLNSSGFSYKPFALDVISPGAYTTVQDLPARKGVGFGIPESGPMDSVAFQIANILVGNSRTKEGLEVTFMGPELLFYCDTIVSVTGANIPITIIDSNTKNKTEGLMWERIYIKAGQRLKLGTIKGPGCRAYIGIKGGFPNVAEYLGSKSTSPTISVGGFQGRQLVAGDYLELKEIDNKLNENEKEKKVIIPKEIRPHYSNDWDLYVMSGPHDSDDFITRNGRKTLYNKFWTVSQNSNRGGIRLEAPNPKLEWSRTNGGEGGSHPSNVLDYGYPIGAMNWTGDEPVLFPIDSPSLGGFLTSCVVVRPDFWRLGQVRPDDKVRFKRISIEQAKELSKKLEDYLDNISKEIYEKLDWNVTDDNNFNESDAIIGTKEGNGNKYKITIRQAGYENVLVEIGDQNVDLNIRCHIQLLLENIENKKINGVDLQTPNLCSILIHYDVNKIDPRELAKKIIKIYENTNETTGKIKSREIHLPLTFDDSVIKYTTERYMETQRPYASYLPDSIDFIARSNGLKNKQTVLEYATSTPLIVIGVGFLCGTPIGIPMDPRKRLVVPKYNPSRRFSPEGGVGIGGSFVALDPVEAPGGYVLYGRTIPGWDTFGRSNGFSSKKPWLFNNFDIVYLYHVTEEEFNKQMLRFKAGKYKFDIRQDKEFDVQEYNKFVTSVLKETEIFKNLQSTATEKEMKIEKELLTKWENEIANDDNNNKNNKNNNIDLNLEYNFNSKNIFPLRAEMHSSIWKIKVKKDDKLKQGKELFILEAMKMEIIVSVPTEAENFIVDKVFVNQGDVVKPGQLLLVAKSN